MQDQNEQISLGKLLGRGVSSPAGLPGIATVCLLLAVFLPVVIFKIPRDSQLITLGLFDNITVSGLNYIGWWIFIPVAAFGVASLTRMLPAIASYRKLADQVAFLALAAILVWAVMGGAIGADIREAREQMRAMMGSRAADQFRFIIFPYFGAVLAVVAPILLAIARIRERPARTKTTASSPSGNARSWASRWGVVVIAIGLAGIAACGFAIVGIVGFFVFGGVGPNWLRFMFILFLLVLVAAAAVIALGYVLSAKLNRATEMKRLVTAVIGTGSVVAGILIGIMTAVDRRVDSIPALLAVLTALIPLALVIAMALASRRTRSAGQG